MCVLSHPPGSSVHEDSPEKNTGMDCHALLQGIFPTQGSNPGLPHYRQMLCPLSHQGSLELTEAEDIKMRWQEYTEELYKKDRHDPDNHGGVVTDLEPDILECEVKALESLRKHHYEQS